MKAAPLSYFSKPRTDIGRDSGGYLLRLHDLRFPILSTAPYTSCDDGLLLRWRWWLLYVLWRGREACRLLAFFDSRWLGGAFLVL